jgi:hypothetical protein
MILPESTAGCTQARRYFCGYPWIIVVSVLRIIMRLTGQEERPGVTSLTFMA